ncbi:MAG: hypothetical protein GTO24_15215 [candidate division Zixibacteria bacterium]|nr:hypothetical protein [candidate division Zixibacteria bacterium]
MDGRVSTLLTFILIILVSACAGSSFGEDVQGDPVEIDELQAKLADQRLQSRLGVKEITILGTETYRVLLGTKGSDQPIDEMYYTIQDGWHLKADHKVMEFVRGKGWLISEQ